MKKNILWALLIVNSTGLFAQDWKSLSVPADAGKGRTWVLQESSDDFNYTAPGSKKGEEFSKKWTDFYHNAWTGPGLTIWDRGHSFVENGHLQMNVSRTGTKKVNSGCITSKTRVIYPVYIEAKAKVMNSVLASDVWLLSPDDTQEIDILEAYGSTFSEGANKDQTWFAERIHISHHVFIRQPFQDYQPTDAGSWFRDGTLWKNDFHTYGVYWIDPWNLEYYIDGKMVRKVSGKDIIDPKNFTNGTGLSKEMDIIINVEDQTWRSDQNITPTDNELKDTESHTFKVDWIRVYKPVGDVVAGIENHEDLKIFPNPSKDSIRIESIKKIDSIEIYDLKGIRIQSILPTENIKIFSLKGLNAGLYIFRIGFSNGTNIDKKIVIE